MKEKVARATFHDGDVLDGLIKEMEDEYTFRFGACWAWVTHLPVVLS
jgi:hypothetical protein